MSNFNTSRLIIEKNSLPHSEIIFSTWQSKFRSQILQAPGFTSLEILSPLCSQRHCWIITQRFDSKENLDAWLHSNVYQGLLKDLSNNSRLENSSILCQEPFNHSQNGVTEIYVTVVDQMKLSTFHQWHEKIHRIESTFPGFQKVYVQAPDAQKKEGAWITLLQFDTSENLESWLNSTERAEILKESQDFITSRETHRLLSSFGGLFIEKSLAMPPPKWKQTMLVLMVLFPIVMFQYTFLTPRLTSLNLTLRTFIENIISVTLITWPMLPLVIYALKWWLELRSSGIKNLMGTAIVLTIYAIEIIFFLYLNRN